jgi:hypothetical protein
MEIRHVQVRIGEAKPNVLRKMHKGVSAVQNVLTVLLGRKLDVQVHYYLLYGFPDDDAGEYKRMRKLSSETVCSTVSCQSDIRIIPPTAHAMGKFTHKVEQNSSSACSQPMNAL